MNRQIDGEIGKYAARQIGYIQYDLFFIINIYKQMDRQIGKYVDEQIDRQMERQVNMQMNRWIDRQIDR